MESGFELMISKSNIVLNYHLFLNIKLTRGDSFNYLIKYFIPKAYQKKKREEKLKVVLLGINHTQPDPKRRFKSQIMSKQIRIMIISEV